MLVPMAWVTYTSVKAPLKLKGTYSFWRNKCCHPQRLFLGRLCLFQQDNAKPHSARVTTAWLCSKRVGVPFLDKTKSGKCCDRLVKMCARRTAEYEEDLCAPKDKNEPQRQLLDAAFNLQPPTVLRRPDISEALWPERQGPEPPHIKEEVEFQSSFMKKEDEECLQIKEEEEEPPYIKQEKEEEDITKLPSTGVPLKSENEVQSEEKRGVEPPSSSSSQHMTTEGDGDHCGGSQADGLLAPLSDCDNMTSHSSDYDDDEQSEDTNEDLRSEQQEPESPHVKEELEGKEVPHIKEEEELEPLSIKKEEDEECLHIKEEEEEPPYIKQEKEEEDITKLPSTGVPLKSENEVQSEESRGAKPPSSSSSQHMTAEGDGEHCGGSQADGLFAPHSDSDMMSHSPHTDNDGQSEGDMTCHTDNKQWKCSQCGKTFASKRSLKQHMKLHTGEKPFACSDCGQRFTYKGNLKIHTRIHTHEKPYACSVCGQRFTQNGSLKLHTRIHTGNKPFACSVCGQKFTQKGHLEMHTRSHTREKSFACSACGKKFSRQENLRIHTRMHTGEKPFSCSVCHQRFSIKKYLIKHQKTHTDDKPFACSDCGQRFTQNVKGQKILH
ncbi:zinc finger protein 37-like isoform X3 [Phyllopteryx taeniolatus]|uniref:zinc finger protein 37-like isoform X3 n=1 Tax=Phyllopteryx taeniolatus TaxID=161469 RepID=UPI002AD3849B|nr:zinc finger protein 37-like isoform X3 [Phyllopteryx taeniolatus]